MNALIKKEIRLILPAWIAAMILAVAPVWFIHNRADFFLIPALCLMLGTLFLGIASFGQEFSFKTFSLLLSQPISRNRFWTIKTCMLATAFISVFLAGFGSLKIFLALNPSYQSIFFQSDFSNWGIISVWVLAFFSGGLWTTLLLRQITAAFWVTILVPGAALVLSAGIAEHYHLSDKIVFTFFIIYSIAGFFWARHLFLNAQDTQWSGGEISFPWRKKISERAVFSTRPSHWILALVKKEFQLHQANILIAALVLALHLASVVIRKVHPNFENPNVKFILDATWALWLAMPLLIGSVAVAEERRLGIIESQLCLPISRRAQLFIKFSVALVLSLILGGVMPLLIELAKDLDFHIYYVAAAIFFISFYASTLARTTLQAIGLAIIVAVAIYLYEVATAVGIYKFGYNFTDGQYGVELLKLYLGIPILLLTFGWLTFRNFKWLHENWKLWRRNFIVVLVAFVMIFVLSIRIGSRFLNLIIGIQLP